MFIGRDKTADRAYKHLSITFYAAWAFLMAFVLPLSVHAQDKTTLPFSVEHQDETYELPIPAGFCNEIN